MKPLSNIKNAWLRRATLPLAVLAIGFCWLLIFVEAAKAGLATCKDYHEAYLKNLLRDLWRGQ